SPCEIHWVDAAPASKAAVAGATRVRLFRAAVVPMRSVQVTASGVCRGSTKSDRSVPAMVHAPSKHALGEKLVLTRAFAVQNANESGGNGPSLAEMRSWHCATQTALPSACGTGIAAPQFRHTAKPSGNDP